MILITIKRNDGSIEKRHVGDDETSVRDVIVSRHLGSVSGSIDDDVSQKVKSQYEENPYPRWRYANNSK